MKSVFKVGKDIKIKYVRGCQSPFGDKYIPYIKINKFLAQCRRFMCTLPYQKQTSLKCEEPR
jgi:hypothetical protein